MDIFIKHQKIAGVYIIKNKLNNKFYIGSSISIYYRLRRHLCDLRKNRHGNPHLQNAWNKYGESNFEASIIEECNKNITFEREQYYIDNMNPEYNVVRNVLTVDRPPEMRLRISETLKKKYKTGEVLGYKQNHNWKPVFIYDLEGNFVKEFQSPKHAANELNLPYNQVLKCLHVYPTDCRCGKFQATYVRYEKLKKIKYHPNQKEVAYELSNNTIIADSLTELSIKLNVHRHILMKAIEKGFYKGYPLYYTIPSIKSGELLENPEMDNQQPNMS